MNHRLNRIAAAILAAHALPVMAQEEAAAELSPVTVEGASIRDYKSDEASSPKFTAPLLDTPRSVTVINSEVLRDSGSTSLQDALRVVPGITFGAGEGGQPIADRPIIRGLNSTANVFVDGVRDIGTQTREIFALESVEVIRGADSVYSGRGSGGGSINLVSKTPKPEAFTSGTLMIGTDDLLRGTLDRNWRLGEDVGARLNVLGTKGGTPGRDNAVDFEKWGIAPSITVGIDSATRLTAGYYHLTDNGMPDYSIPYDLASGQPATETLGVDSDRFFGLVSRDFREAKTDIATLTAARDLDNGFVLRNVTRYGTSTNSYVVTNPDDSKGNVANGLVYRNTKSRFTETDTFANVTDLSGVAQVYGFEHRFNIGLEFSREEKVADGWNVVSDGAGTGTDCSDPVQGPLLLASGDCTDLFAPNPYDPWSGTVSRRNDPTYFTTDITSLYGLDSVSMSPRWQGSFGLRWDQYQTEAIKPSDPAVNGISRDSFLNYQVGLVFKPVPNSSIYASLSTTTTPASLGNGDEDSPNPGSPDSCTSRCRRDNTNLDPEETLNLELGTKWALFADRMLVSAALFQMTRENAEIEVAADIFEQVGEAEVRGLELSLSGSVTPRWNVFGGYTYLDTELVRGAFDSAAVGEVLPNTPEHSLSVTTRYEVTPTLTVGGGAFYVSEVYGSTSSSPKKQIPEYWRFDALLGWRINRNFDVQVNVQNLADEVYYTKAYAAHYAALGSGRQVLVSTHFSF